MVGIGQFTVGGVWFTPSQLNWKPPTKVTEEILATLCDPSSIGSLMWRVLVSLYYLVQANPSEMVVLSTVPAAS